MATNDRLLALIGFGEAGAAFAAGLNGTVRAYDRKGIEAKHAAFAAAGIEGCATNAAAVAGAAGIWSLVTADQAFAAAQESAASIERGGWYFDCNSVAPETKARAAVVISAAGGHYVDVAVMAPVNPLQLAVPLLVAGPQARAGAEVLRGAGFSQVAIAGDRIGEAAAIKMIRSVMIKGIEALSVELAAAADAAGIRGAVIDSLDASWPAGLRWAARIDGAIERVARHGQRRAAEMDEVAATLAALGIEPRMTSAAAATQRAGIAACRSHAA